MPAVLPCTLRSLRLVRFVSRPCLKTLPTHRWPASPSDPDLQSTSTAWAYYASVAATIAFLIAAAVMDSQLNVSATLDLRW